MKGRWQPADHTRRAGPPEWDERVPYASLPSERLPGLHAIYRIPNILGSTVPGANFATGNGLGVAVVVEAVAPVEPPRGATAFLNVVEVSLDSAPGLATRL